MVSFVADVLRLHFVLINLVLAVVKVLKLILLYRVEMIFDYFVNIIFRCENIVDLLAESKVSEICNKLQVYLFQSAVQLFLELREIIFLTVNDNFELLRIVTLSN